MDFGGATWKAHCGQKRCRDRKLMSRHKVTSRRVATWFWCRDLDRPGWCRDLGGFRRQRGGLDKGLMSRPGLVVQEVAT